MASPKVGPRFLTATLPAVGTSTYVALPVALVAVATSVSAEIALRSRWKAGPIIAPIGVLVVALLFTGKRPLPSLALVVAITLLALLTVFVRVHRQAAVSALTAESRPSLDYTSGRASIGPVFGLPTMVAIAVLAAGLGSVLPITSKSHRVDLRDRYHPPVQIAQSITPLALVQSQLNSHSDTPLFTVRFRGVPPGDKIDRVPIAILDTYDGAVWGTNASFTLVGSELPSGPEPPQPGPVVRQDYKIGAYGLSFLPALEQPIRAAGSHLAFDRVSGMLATSTPAPAGYKYSVASELPDQSRVASGPVKPGNDPNFAPLALAPPQGWPKAITDFANKFSAKTPYATLQLMAQELRSRDFGYNKTARPGHSLGLLGAFLTAPAGSSQVTTARVGYAEQFAAVFAVLARVKGYPSEVVVGYRVNPAAAARGTLWRSCPAIFTPGCRWISMGTGWVAFDPTNATPRNSAVPSALPPPPPPPPAPVITGTIGHGNHNVAPGGSHHASSYWWIFLVIAAFVASPAAVVGIKAAAPAAAGPQRHHYRPGGRRVARRTRESPVARRQSLARHDHRRRRPRPPARPSATMPPPASEPSPR